ncbi:MAG: hypothetical protein JO033_15350 [Acidobacteriaceae bacterium]|nr:hypothetical protein [Acidobacteriaceae bacterium]MBV9501076.1 hypothetical protein [Acidobacteriaceae bacterium]
MKCCATFCASFFVCGLLTVPALADDSDIPRGSDVSAAAAAPALPAPDQAETLKLVRAANEDLYSSLQSFICDEQIERFRAHFNGDSPRQIDTIAAKLSFENGIEHYSDILHKGKRRTSLSSVVGAWSEGEFGTLLLQTEKLFSTQAVEFLRYSELNGRPMAVYAFAVSSEDSPWDLEVSGGHYRVPFQTEVSVDRDSGQIVKIARTADALPPAMRISEIYWGVTLELVELSGQKYLLPRSGEYAVLYQQSDRRDWNLLIFSNYHRYDVQTSLRFDGAQ